MSDAKTRLKQFGWVLVAISLAIYWYALAGAYGTTSIGYLGGIVGGMGIGALWVRKYVIYFEERQQ